MSSTDVPTTGRTAPRAARNAGIRGPKVNLPKITVDGDEWGPCNDFAAETGVHPKTVERKDYPRVTWGGVAYMNFTAAKREIFSQAKRRKEAPADPLPPVRRRSRHR